MPEEVEAEDTKIKWLLVEARKLTDIIKLPEGLILQIYAAPSDWEFILKVDALLETAVKHVVKECIKGSRRMNEAKLEGFVDALSMRGRTSLLALLKATGCSDEEIHLIDGVRRLRNGFAHDILQVDLSLIEVIKKRNDKSELIKWLSYVENYNECQLVKAYEKDGRLLRVWILHGMLAFLVLAYHVIFRPKSPEVAN